MTHERIAGLRNPRGRTEFTELSEFNAWPARLGGSVGRVLHHGVVAQVSGAKGGVVKREPAAVESDQAYPRLAALIEAIIREYYESEARKGEKGAA